MKIEAGITLVKRDNIDEAKWERCIADAPNSRIYANIWHLDRTADNWDALVFADYEYVMPLPVKRKFFINYVYQPLFCQQLGIFPKPPANIATLFYKAVYGKFRFADVHLNSLNSVLQDEAGIRFLPRQNFLLDLQYNYKALARNYSTNTKRNIAKSAENNLQFIVGIPVDEYMAFKDENLASQLSIKETEKLKSIIANARYRGIGEIYGVYNATNEICAAVFFCRWKNRVIYMNAATSSTGKQLGAMYFLLDRFIHQNAESNLILDFEGSMIPGVARFYSGFGAIAETYFQLRINRLPALVKWIKPV